MEAWSTSGAGEQAVGEQQPPGAAAPSRVRRPARDDSGRYPGAHLSQSFTTAGHHTTAGRHTTDRFGAPSHASGTGSALHPGAISERSGITGTGSGLVVSGDTGADADADVARRAHSSHVNGTAGRNEVLVIPGMVVIGAGSDG